MNIPTERPANANETLTASETAVLIAASILVFATTILRYTGRWVLQKRLEAGKGRNGEKILGLDDRKSIVSQDPQTVPPLMSNWRQCSTCWPFSLSMGLSWRLLSRLNEEWVPTLL
jgi:hypothetical protein